MLAMGAGGLDVAVAMGGGAYYITMPKVVKVNLTGKLNDWVSAKDVILKVLQIMSVKGGVGKVIEYCGEGVKSLSVPERATITNMGAELGATTSIFPSDETTLAFLKAQDREEDFVALSADPDAVYDEEINIDLSELVPMAACPHSPDNVKTVKRNRCNQDRSGMYRIMYQLLITGYAQGCSYIKGQDGTSRCKPFNSSRLKAGIQYACRLRCVINSYRRRCKNT